MGNFYIVEAGGNGFAARKQKKNLLLHFKSGKISVIIFLGLLLMELHFQFMNVVYNIPDPQTALLLDNIYQPQIARFWKQ